MKNNLFILIVFSLVLPFASYAQKNDSSSAQTKTESKFDSTIIKKQIQGSLGKVYTMNGEEISDHDLKLRLFTFKSSASEYEKSKHWRGGLAPLIASPIVGVSGIFAYFVIRGSGFDDNNNFPALFFCFCWCISYRRTSRNYYVSLKTPPFQKSHKIIQRRNLEKE